MDRHIHGNSHQLTNNRIGVMDCHIQRESETHKIRYNGKSGSKAMEHTNICLGCK